MIMRVILFVLASLTTSTLWAVMPQEATLKGTFVWLTKPNETHELKGCLTSTGSNEWKVVWNFTWQKKPMTYIGTVTGDLRNGKVIGTGNTTEGRERKFLFEGIAKDGVIEFQHFEVTTNRKPTGDGKMRLVN